MKNTTEFITIVLNGQSNKIKVNRKEDGTLPNVNEVIASAAEALGIPANVTYYFNSAEVTEDTPVVPGGVATVKTKTAEKN